MPLSGAPSVRWARSLATQLMLRLTGQRSGRNLVLRDVVQGADVVLERVDDETEARQLGGVLHDAVEAANDVATRSAPLPEPGNMPQEDADRIALALESGVRAKATGGLAGRV